MILPVFIIIADIAAWWFSFDLLTFDEPLLGTVGFGFALAFLVWLLIEVMELVQASNTDRSARDTD